MLLQIIQKGKMFGCWFSWVSGYDHNRGYLVTYCTHGQGYTYHTHGYRDCICRYTHHTCRDRKHQGYRDHNCMNADHTHGYRWCPHIKTHAASLQIMPENKNLYRVFCTLTEINHFSECTECTCSLQVHSVHSLK